jgi:agmatinase
VQFDSHPDTWDAYFGQKHTHGTPFRRAVEEGLLKPKRSIQVGMRGSLFDSGDWNDARELGFELISTDEIREIGISKTLARIHERIGDSKTYVSFDVDFVDPAFAPGTGTPEVGGFTSREAQVLVRGLGNMNIVGCDVVEVYPACDPGQITAFLAANLAYELLSLIAARRRDEPAHDIGRESTVRR